MKTFISFCRPFLTVFSLTLSLLFCYGQSSVSAQEKAAAKQPAKQAEKQPAKQPEKPAEKQPVKQNTEDTQPLARYNAWKIDAELAGNRTDIMNAFKAGTAGPADRDAFLDNYYFARWTDPSQMGQVQNFSKEFLQDLKDSTGSARDAFLRKSFETLKKMTDDASITPTARYNAILAVGQLIQREPPNRNDPPTAFAPALPFLIAEYEKEGNPEYIRLGALIGITRHAAMGIADAEMKNTMVPNLFIKIIESGKPVADRDKDDQELLNWFRLRALDGLADMKSVGQNAKVVKALFEIIENPQETINIQVNAARVLGELDWKAAGETSASIEFQRLGTQLISLAKRVTDAEVQIVDDLLAKEKAVASGGMGGMGGYSEGMGEYSPMPTTMGPLGASGPKRKFEDLPAEQQLEVRAVVERLKMELFYVNYGIRGLRFTGTASVGIITQLPNDDPVAKKLTSTCREMFKLYRMLDEGPVEEAKKPVRGAAGSSQMDEMMSESSGSDFAGRGRQPSALPKDTKPLKVSLDNIQEELKRLSTALDGIISGGG